MIRNWIAVAVVIVLAVIACKLGPNYKRPPLRIPNAYKTGAPETTTTLQRDWWRLFNDPDLDALMEEGLAANQDIWAAMARLTQARAQAAAVRSQFYPIITLNPTATRSRIPAAARSTTSATGTPRPSASPTPNVGPTPSPGTQPTPIIPGTSTGTFGGAFAGAASGPTRGNFFQIPFDLNYEVDVWGRVRRQYEAANAQARASAYDLEFVRQTVLAELAQDYFNLRSFEEQDRITERNVQLYRDQLDLTLLQFKAGLISETNVLQARTLLDSTLAQELELRRQRNDLEHSIAILLGRPPADFSLPTTARTITPPTIPVGLPAELLRRRPDVAVAEQNLVAANAQIGVETANLFPALRLTGAAGWESANSGHLLDWESHFWTISGNISAPIFEGGLLRANLRNARARYLETEANYRNAVLASFRDVEDALNDLQMRALAAEAQARAVEWSRGYVQLAQQQYQTGLINYLQVIDADRTLLSNELTQAQILYERMISTILLIKALGGGWDAQTSLNAPAARDPAKLTSASP